MPIKAKKKVIFCKAETTYGTDAVPVAATDSMLVHNFACVPVVMNMVERDPVMPFFGNQGQVKVGDYMTMEYEIEVAGAGAVAAVPGYSPAMLGCAFSQTITPTTGPVTYANITSAEQSVTKYFYWDGLLHKLLGARGTSELRMSATQVPMIHTSWIGLYGGITDVAMPAPVLTAFQKPVAVNKINTTFTLYGFTGVLSSLTITQGCEHVYKNAPNSEAINFIGRKSKGSVTIELPLITAKDFFSICRAEPPTLGALAVTHGVTAGNKFIVAAAGMRVINPKYSEAEGVALLSMDFDLQPTAAGNDEFTYATQ